MPLTGHAFHEIYLHINWHCSHDRLLLTPEIEKACHTFLETYCTKTKGITFYGVGGTADHIHLAIQSEPFIAPADFIGKIKGASAHEINARFGKAALQWQRGYGVVSFGKKNLSAVLDYIAKQKEHHATGRGLNATLESTASGTTD